MITIIDQDGNEFAYGDQNAVTLARKGRYDRDVACYRNREWILTTMSRLEVGDAFRFLDGETLSEDKVFIVLKPPKVFHHPSRPYLDPDILVQGLTVQQLCNLYDTVGLPLRIRESLPYSPTMLRISS
jgi:hypothetical protein